MKGAVVKVTGWKDSSKLGKMALVSAKDQNICVTG